MCAHTRWTGCVAEVCGSAGCATAAGGESMQGGVGAWRSGEEHATWTSRAEAIVALRAQEHVEGLHHDRLRLRNESNNSPI